MKKHIFVTLVLIAVLLLAAGFAAAKSPKRTEFTGIYYNCGATGEAEDMWTTGDGNVLHMRDEPGHGFARSDNPYYNAYTTALASYDLNQVTGSGGFRGTFIKDVDGVDGGWEGTAAGYFRDGMLYHNVVGHGTGDLSGMKYFARFVPNTDPLPPQPDPCLDLPGGAAAVAVADVTGVILNTRGDEFDKEAEEAAVVAVSVGIDDAIANADREAVLAAFHEDQTNFVGAPDYFGSWTYQDIGPDWFTVPSYSWWTDYDVFVAPGLAVIKGARITVHPVFNVEFKQNGTVVFVKEDGEWKLIHTHISYGGP